MNATQRTIETDAGSVLSPLLLTPEEAAELLRIGRATLYRLLAHGDIRSVTIGASRRIAVADLHAYVERLRAEQGEGDEPGGAHEP